MRLYAALFSFALLCACGAEQNGAGGPLTGDAPHAEAPADAAIDPESPRGAKRVAETYFSFLEQRRAEQAYALWTGMGAGSGMDMERFAGGFDAYSDYRAEVGEPGRIEGAAGSLYIDIPVEISGRMAADNSEFSRQGVITLKRSNDVPGATEEQRQWRIYEIKMTDEV